MRTTLLTALMSAAALLPGASSVSALSPPRSLARASVPQVRQPNVVVILVDDLDWADVSTYGRHDVRTPNIDRLAKSGVAFSSGYVAASVCAVSRAGLLTGRRPAEFGFTYNINDDGDPGKGLPTTERTLAERLKPLGYRTGAFGKWHQGAERQFYPTNRGFDQFYGFLAGETVYVDPKTPGIVTTPTKADKYPLDHRKGNGVTVEGPDARPVDDFGKYMTSEITRRAVDFIDTSAGKPFFAYVAYNAPHWPLQVPQAYYDRFATIKDPVRRTYVAMIAAMDEGVGQVLDALDRKGVRDNTIVVFLSDNGCPVQFGFCNPSHPWGAGKFTYLEGGIRVPFVLSWPAKLKPQGIVDTPVTSLDIVPTVLRAADPRGALPSGLDGADLLTMVQHPPKTPRTLLWGQEPVFAARRGAYKLWHSDDWQQTYLYDLPADEGERVDLSAAEPQERARLEASLAAWRKTLPAPLWPRRTTRKVTINGHDTEFVY
ncbi:sulfatase-like hydrolase/transferase [Sphingomonas paucimobilis]|uniref:sulfatase-like hydrolase/transferase n=1 Tax=Sphingomonas paucimobilis TaxID=13689 RepID=UPI0028D28775|nr:sulfatase-like hydrolase/transferase [Sphingomonas paucimobilis]